MRNQFGVAASLGLQSLSSSVTLRSGYIRRSAPRARLHSGATSGAPGISGRAQAGAGCGFDRFQMDGRGQKCPLKRCFIVSFKDSHCIASRKTLRCRYLVKPRLNLIRHRRDPVLCLVRLHFTMLSHSNDDNMNMSEANVAQLLTLVSKR